MIFNSAEFLIFYPLVLFLYFILPKKCKWPLLLAASYFFYMIWNPPLIFLILFTTGVSYVSALLIEKQKAAAKRNYGSASRLSHRSACCSFSSISISLPAPSSRCGIFSAVRQRSFP